MPNRFYRLRGVKSLFEFGELQNQEIYFAHPEQLNDPMEGFRDIFWQGNEIVWRNLFKHYILSLQNASIQLLVCGEKHCRMDKDGIQIFAGFDNHPTPMYKELFDAIASEFLKECDDLIRKITSRSTPIKRDGLHLYFNAIHPIAIGIIGENFARAKIIPEQNPSDKKQYQSKDNLKLYIETIDGIEKKILEGDENKIIDFFSLIKSNVNIGLAKANNSESLANTPNQNFIMMGFPEQYINSLEKLMYPNWYTASFMTQKGACNSSVWGHYGDGHKGVCLIFESDENNFINLSSKNRYSKHEFKKINYQEGFEEIDFWKSLGHLPSGTLNSTWFFDEQANKSVISDFIPSANEDEWRMIYRENFYRDITIKLKDWAYEQEYRLILTALHDDEIEEQYRKLKYDFKSLKGIVFGIKTTEADKAEIMKAIADKCKENGISLDEFAFYQAVYSHTEKKIQHYKIRQLTN